MSTMMNGIQNGKTVPLGTGTSTVSDCKHGLKKYAKKYWEEHKGTNFFVQWQNVKPIQEYIPDEVMQGLWKYEQALESARATLRDMPQESP